jgi:CheY-like chemotaxis protein
MRKLLIVDDSELNIELLVQLLEDDFDLVTAFNGEEGVEVSRRERPDLVLMDMSLPVMDGWEATRRIKADPELAHIPVIGLSAHAMDGDAGRALAAGCDGYLTKPIDDDALFATLERWLPAGV